MSTASDVSIQEATVTDIKSIAALLSEMRGEAILHDTIATQFTDYFTTSPERCVLIARGENGVALGMLVLNTLFKLPKIEVRVDEVIVAEVARGKGVGTLLMNAAEAWAWQHHAQEVGFTSRPSREAANRLYAKLDYELRETNVYRKKQPKSEV